MAHQRAVEQGNIFIFFSEQNITEQSHDMIDKILWQYVTIQSRNGDIKKVMSTSWSCWFFSPNLTSSGMSCTEWIVLAASVALTACLLATQLAAVWLTGSPVTKAKLRLLWTRGTGLGTLTVFITGGVCVRRGGSAELVISSLADWLTKDVWHSNSIDGKLIRAVKQW